MIRKKLFENKAYLVNKISSVVTLIFLVACNSDDDNASFRFIHASPDAPALEVLIDDNVEAEDIRYLDATDYFGVDDDFIDITIKEVGTFTTLFNDSVDLEEGDDVTFILTDFEENATAFILEDDNSGPDSGNVRIRLVHTAPSLPDLDVYITEPNVDLNTVVPTVSNFGFLDQSGYTEGDAGGYQIRATPANLPAPVLLDSGILELTEGEVNTLLLVDAEDGGRPFSVSRYIDR